MNNDTSNNQNNLNINNPQDVVNEIESTTSNVGLSNNHVVISESKDIKAKKYTEVLATIDNGTLNTVATKLPDPIDLDAKAKLKVKKNGKRIKVVTFRERVTNFITTIILLCILGGFGYGVYYYIYQHNPRNFEAKNVVLELGEAIPQNSSYYVSLNDISEPEYKLDLSNVKEEIGTYNYTIRYDNTIKSGTITIRDTTEPIITFKEELTFNVGDNVTKDSLVLECIDKSDCTYELKNIVDTTKVGKKDVTIFAYDSYNNSKEYTTEIEIVEIVYSLVCSKNRLSDDIKYMSKEEYSVKFNQDYNYLSGKRSISYIYLDEEAYINSKDDYDDTYVVNDNEKTFSKVEEQNSINNLTGYDDIKNNLEKQGYNCGE